MSADVRRSFCPKQFAICHCGADAAVKLSPISQTIFLVFAVHKIRRIFFLLRKVPKLSLFLYEPAAFWWFKSFALSLWGSFQEDARGALKDAVTHLISQSLARKDLGMLSGQSDARQTAVAPKFSVDLFLVFNNDLLPYFQDSLQPIHPFPLSSTISPHIPLHSHSCKRQH